MPPSSSANLVGRTEQIARIEDLLALADEGHGQAVLLSGDTGCGKSRLAHTLCTESGFCVYEGRALPGHSYAYQLMSALVRQAFRENPALADSSPSQTVNWLRDGATGPDGHLPQDPAQLAEQLAGGVLELAGGDPTIFLLEDLHNADFASLALLPHLTERVRNRQVLLFLTARTLTPADTTHPMRETCAELRRLENFREIPLPALTREQTGELAHQLLGAPLEHEALDRLFGHSGGTPFYVEELCRALQSHELLQEREGRLTLVPQPALPVPAGIRDAISLHLKPLSPEARAALETAAIAGEQFELELFAPLFEHPKALDELFAAGLLVEEPDGRARFPHVLTCETVAGAVPWSRRREIHRQIAHLLETARAEPSRIARHWAACGEKTRARKAFLTAVRKSCMIYAYADAAHLLEEALSLWPESEDLPERLQALAQFAHCAETSGNIPKAAELWKDIQRLQDEHAGDLGDTEKIPVTRVLANLARSHSLLAEWTAAHDYFRQSIEACLAAGDCAAAAVEGLALSELLTNRIQLKEGQAVAEAALEALEQTPNPDTESRLLSQRGLILAMRGSVVPGRRSIEKGLEIAVKNDLKDAATVAYSRMALASDYASDFHQERRLYTNAISFCRQEGLNERAVACLGCMAYAVFRTGDWTQSAQICRDVMQSDDAPAAYRRAADGILGLVEVHRGEIRSAQKRLQDCLEDMLRFDVVPMQFILQWGLALVEEQKDHPTEAAKIYRRILDLWKTTDDLHDSVPALGSAAGFFAEQRLEPEMARATEIASRIVAQTGNAEAAATLALYLGETALAQNRFAEAKNHFQQSLEQVDRLRIPYEVARARFRLGAATIAAGDRDGGIAHLHSAYRTAKNLGARPLAGKIATLLEHHGEQAEESRSETSTTRAANAGLTERQVEVAQALAAGLTNKEIAQKLYISPRTVDMHVSRLFNRLDCRTRTEAVKKLGDLGVV